MILDIVQIGDPVLRRKAHKITQIDRDIRLLAEDMVETLRDSGGVGLRKTLRRGKRDRGIERQHGVYHRQARPPYVRKWI